MVDEMVLAISYSLVHSQYRNKALQMEESNYNKY